jgi:hypothetical protein
VNGQRQRQPWHEYNADAVVQSASVEAMPGGGELETRFLALVEVGGSGSGFGFGFVAKLRFRPPYRTAEWSLLGLVGLVGLLGLLALLALRAAGTVLAALSFLPPSSLAAGC